MGGSRGAKNSKTHLSKDNFRNSFLNSSLIKYTLANAGRGGRGGGGGQMFLAISLVNWTEEWKEHVHVAQYVMFGIKVEMQEWGKQHISQ